MLAEILGVENEGVVALMCVLVVLLGMDAVPLYSDGAVNTHTGV